jgi:phosphatidylglycerophosphate synthase
VKLIDVYLRILLKSKNTFIGIKFSKFPLHNILFRIFSFYITPIFILLKISANQATLLRILIGLISTGLVFFGEVFLGIIFFFIGDIIDCTDGNIARVNNTATYYGKFLDGYVDVIIENLLIVALAKFYISNINLTPLEISLFLFAILINLSFNFLLDRFHNFLRWVRETKKKINYISLLNSKNLIINNVLNDLRYLMLVLILVDQTNKNIIFFFLIISIFYSTHKIILVFLNSKKNLDFQRVSDHERK